MSILFFLLILLFHPLRADQYEERFDTIYREKLWGVNQENEGYSGGGSDLENVLPYYQYLTQFIKDHHIRSVVDLGCGDWTFSKWVDWTGIDYIGYDVVASVVEKNRQKYGSDHIRFVHANFLTEDIPKADLMICKHVLQHMPTRDVFLVLQRLPKFKYSLILNAGPVGKENIEYSVSETFPFWEDRGIDVRLSPFHVNGRKVLEYAQPSNCSGVDILIQVDANELYYTAPAHFE
jgi:SAM-dependent methyltransferase